MYASKITQADRLGNEPSGERSRERNRLSEQVERKHHADKLTKIYGSSSEVNHRKYAERMRWCGHGLTVEQGWNQESERDVRVHTMHCNVRYCPLCQAAKARRAVCEFAPIVLEIEEKYPEHVWLFLTITVKNVPADELRNAFTGLLNPGMSRLTRRKAWPAIGWTISREVTRGTRGDAHPHLHVLMLVPAAYLSSGYMQQSEWVDLVQDAFKLNYKPSIRISRVQGKDGLHKAVLETFKYTVKSQDLIGDRSWCFSITDQMHGLRARSHGGVFRELLARMSDEDTDLEDADEFEHLWFTPDPAAELTFLVWNHREKKYVQVDQPQPCHVVPWGAVEKWWIRDNLPNTS